MIRALSAALLALFVAAPALAQAVDPPTVTAGDRWVYDNNSGKRSLHVDSVAGDGTIEATIDAPGLSGLAIKFTRNWNISMAPIVMLGNVQYQRYSPPVCLMPDGPWSVGKTWSCDANWSSTSYSGTVHVTGKLAAAEKVTVPAGTFDTLRAELNVGGSAVTCWFAPQVKSWAQCKSGLPDYNYTLTSYNLK